MERTESKPLGSRRSRPSTTSISPTNDLSPNNRSLISTSSTFCVKPTTWSSSARPAPARPTSPSHLGVQAARRGYRVAFASATEWVMRLGEAKRNGKLADELERLGRIPLLIVDEVGYIPFDPDAASLFFQLVSSRYEQSSLIVSSNKSFSAWAEIFGDAVAVEAMVDRLVHHSHVLVLKGDSYRLKDKQQEVMATTETT